VEASLIQLGDHDRVFAKPLYKYPVPTAHEVKLFLDYLPEGHYRWVANVLLIVCGLRPVEVARLRWHDFRISESGEILDFKHFIYKPTNRKTLVGNNYYFKQAIKPVLAWSPWLNDVLKKYARSCPSYPNDRLFPFTRPDSLRKDIIKLRKKVKKGKMPSDYEVFLEQNNKQLFGDPMKTPYKINIYSLRRFSITFHYWVTFKQDIIKTSKVFGHSDPKTTLSHYIQPKEAIGLTQDMIDQGISIDHFINFEGKKQMRLMEFSPEWSKRFTPAGQTTLFDF